MIELTKLCHLQERIYISEVGTNMAPRKSHEGKVAKWAYDLYKQQSRKLIYGPFECFSCANKSLIINVNKKNKEVFGICSCGLKMKLDYFSSFQPVDYFNKLVDTFHRKTSDKS